MGCRPSAGDSPTADYLWPGACVTSDHSDRPPGTLGHLAEPCPPTQMAGFYWSPVQTGFLCTASLASTEEGAATGWSLGLDQTMPALPL